MQQVEGIKFPDIPGFNINEATDVLLKKHFDKYRVEASIPPFFESHGLEHLVPFHHDNFDKWTESLHFGAEGRMHTVVDELNLKIGGGLDDVWQNTGTKELHIVDYKSTSQKSPGKTITLDEPYKASYKRQMDLYVWVLRRMGFDVSETGYFLYVDGDRFTDRDFLSAHEALMIFKTTLIPYTVDIFWIAPTIVLIIGLFPLPIGYYTLTRLVVCGCAVYYAYSFYQKKENTLTWIFGFLVILYNPIVPVYLYEKAIWVFVNIITIFAFYKYKNKVK